MKTSKVSKRNSKVLSLLRYKLKKRMSVSMGCWLTVNILTFFSSNVSIKASYQRLPPPVGPWCCLFSLMKIKMISTKKANKTTTATTEMFKRYKNSTLFDAQNAGNRILKIFLWGRSCPQENIRQSSEIFGNCWGTFVWPSEQFWKIFEDLGKVVGKLLKIVKNAAIGISTCI